MKILLVSATKAEVSPLLETISLLPAEQGVLTQGEYKGLVIDVLITGVGMASTAFEMGRTLTTSYDFALNLGLAGSFNRHLAIGEVVSVTDDRFSEMGAEDGSAFIPIGAMNLGTDGCVQNESESGNPVLSEIAKVSGITVNTVHGNEQSIELAFERFHPYLESMEGAAFLLACKRVGVKCAQVRCISNYVERRNRNAWNVPLAIQNLNGKALQILDAFSEHLNN